MRNANVTTISIFGGSISTYMDQRMKCFNQVKAVNSCVCELLNYHPSCWCKCSYMCNHVECALLRFALWWYLWWWYQWQRFKMQDGWSRVQDSCRQLAGLQDRLLAIKIKWIFPITEGATSCHRLTEPLCSFHEQERLVGTFSAQFVDVRLKQLFVMALWWDQKGSFPGSPKKHTITIDCTLLEVYNLYFNSFITVV